MNSRIYMDYNATAPLLGRAQDVMISAMSELGNPSSVHQEGQKARRIVNLARDQVAKLSGSQSAHVTFTSGATEAASHLLTPHYKMGRSALKISKLYISAVEHPCVLSGGRFDKDDVVLVGTDVNGLIDLAALEAALVNHDHTLGLPMLALQAVNNETGVIQPIAKAIDIAKAHKAIIVIDAVQAFGKIPFDVDKIGADFTFMSAHKIGGPKGVGAIISRGEVLMPEPLINGGGHEKGHRAGTENIIGIAGFGAACVQAHENLAHSIALGQRRDDLEAKMFEITPDLVIHGGAVARIPNTVCFTLPGMKSETLQIAFDMEGVAASSGSACSSGKVGESHVLIAMGTDANIGALRVSIGVDTRDEELVKFLKAFEKINARRIKQIRKPQNGDGVAA